MKKKGLYVFLPLIFSVLAIASGCGPKSGQTSLVNWEYQDAVIDDKYRNFYEVYVRSFYDSNGDQVGDLRGVGLKMHYIHDLGFNGVWLMPIHPSVSYHKYDVDDYYGIDQEYGNLDDFKFMIQEADKNGIAVIMDLVLNHSSANHDWMRKARTRLASSVCATSAADGTPSEECRAGEEGKYVNYYHFTKNQTSGYHALSGTSYYYEGYFDSNMPDLNLDDENLRSEIVDIMKYWMNLGVKGFRLDAAMHYYSQTRPQKNMDFLAWLESEAKKINPNVYFVAEVWSTSAERQYYASGLDSFFNFTFSGGSGVTSSSVSQQNASKFVTSIESYETAVKKIDETAIVANFLGNHDMQRNANAYIGRTKKDMVKMALGLNQMITGTSWTYYGEEIGMIGASATSDPNYRTAMLWNDIDDPDGDDLCVNPPGSSTVEQIYGKGKEYEEKIGSVKEQQVDDTSILNYLKVATRLRYKYPAIARGTQKAIVFDESTDYAMLEKTYGDEKLYILINLNEDISKISLSDEYASLQVEYTLATNQLLSTKRGNVIQAQPFSITILK